MNSLQVNDFEEITKVSIPSAPQLFAHSLLLQENDRLRDEVKRLQDFERRLAQVGVVLMGYVEGKSGNLYDKVHEVVYGGEWASENRGGRK
jgi:hypothetical protein